MAREPEEHGYFAVMHADGFPRVVHGALARIPDDGSHVPITPEQAAEISAEMRARQRPTFAEAGPAPAAQPAPAVDLQPILDKLEEHQAALGVLAQTAADQAQTIQGQGEKVDAVHEAVTAHFETLKSAQPS